MRKWRVYKAHRTKKGLLHFKPHRDFSSKSDADALCAKKNREVSGKPTGGGYAVFPIAKAHRKGK